MEQVIIYRFFVVIVPTVIGIGLAAWMIALLRRPLRERHEAEVILDLLERADREGRAVERDFVELARQNERALGPHFQSLASWMGQGRPLAEALRKTPEILPEPIRHMLIHGLENNLLAEVISPYRLRLEEAESRWRTTMTIVTSSGCGAAVFSLPMLLFAYFAVLPKIQAIAYDMWGNSVDKIQPILASMSNHWVIWCFVALYILMFVNACLFSGFSPARGMFPIGERLFRNLSALRNRAPWLRLRLERDLSALMTGFLDAGMPAEQALVQAGEAIDDPGMQRQANLAAAKVRAGKSLEQALSGIRDDQQFRWHIRNASRSKAGFAHALGVWHDALSAKAMFREQAAAQISTTVLVILTGSLIAIVCSSIFQFLAISIDRMATW